MGSFDVPLTKAGFGKTSRHDNWWLTPLAVFLGFSAFIVYSTWAAFQGDPYTLGCHSLRHLIGGARDSLAGRGMQRTAYDCVSSLNCRHMRFAWISLFWVGFSDLYVRMCSMGIWTDWRLF